MIKPRYDVLQDENKQFSAEDFVAAAKQELDDWLVEHNKTLAASKSYTWIEWFKNFFNYMSF